MNNLILFFFVVGDIDRVGVEGLFSFGGGCCFFIDYFLLEASRDYVGIDC